jgi:hypothetical protein
MSQRNKALVRSAITVDLVISLTEDQARALDALVGYGTHAFLKVFYTHMGEAYLKPHEKGLISLFETIKEVVPRELATVEHARQLLSEEAQRRRREAKAAAETAEP